MPALLESLRVAERSLIEPDAGRQIGKLAGAGCVTGIEGPASLDPCRPAPASGRAANDGSCEAKSPKTAYPGVGAGYALALLALPLLFGIAACGGGDDKSSRSAALGGGGGEPPPTNEGGLPPGEKEKPPVDSSPKPEPPSELQQAVQDQQKQTEQPPVSDPRPAKRSSCTITGTDGKDVLKGTNRRDVICGLGGPDVIRAGGGRDGVSGGAGRDTIDAGPGNDVIPSRDGEADRINGGSGNDTAELDPRLDRATSVESARKKASARSASTYFSGLFLSPGQYLIGDVFCDNGTLDAFP